MEDAMSGSCSILGSRSVGVEVSGRCSTWDLRCEESSLRMLQYEELRFVKVMISRNAVCGSC